MKLALWVTRLMNWDPRPGTLKFDDEAQTSGSKLMEISNIRSKSYLFVLI